MATVTAPSPATARDFLEAKGDLRPVEVVTCLVVWLADARGFRSVSARDVHEHYRRWDRPPAAAPVRSAADALRRAERAGLVDEVPADAAEGHEAAGGPGADAGSPLTRGLSLPRRPDAGPRFVATALGRRVVETLPDKRGVGALRGLAGAASLYRSSQRLAGR